MSTDIEKKIEEDFEKYNSRCDNESGSFLSHQLVGIRKMAFTKAALPLHSELKELREVLDNQTELIKMRNEEIRKLRFALFRIKNLEISDYGNSKHRFQTDVRNIISYFNVTYDDSLFDTDEEIKP